MAQASDYPVQLSIDYPEASNRLTAVFRLILVIPVIILSAVLGAPKFLAPLLMLLFAGKFPRWWFDWNLQVKRFQARINAYFGLMQDDYPSTEDDQSVHLDIEYPEDLNRFMPLIKWLLAIPHFIVLIVLGLVSLVLTIIAWFAILFTGQYPRALFDVNLGIARWSVRVNAYAFALMTDRYPPFRLSP